MRVIASFVLGVLVAVPVGVASFTIGANLADSRWEYKTQYMQEQYDACLIRDKFEGLRHNVSERLATEERAINVKG